MVTALIAFFVIMLGAAVVLAIIVISIYNNLVALRNRYQNAFAQIDVQLKRRYDLIPNLVETAKGYMKHEKETLDAVITARNAAYSAGSAAASNPGDPRSMQDLVRAESQLGGALGRLLMVAEAYPDLKANETMLSLQEELKSTENKVSFSRQGFNDAVTRYNTGIQQFPAVIIAGMFGFKEAELFEIESKEQREAPKVQF